MGRVLIGNAVANNPYNNAPMEASGLIVREGREQREFAFTRADFDEVCSLIYRHAGISLSSSKQELVYSRLSRRLRAHGLTSFRDYLTLVQEGEANELEAFTNALTTNLTAFFREQHHFPILAELVGRLRARPQSEPLSIWCCAASTGEEPYTIAMTLLESFGTRMPAAKILATDVDTSVLDKAAAGIYTTDRLDKLAPETQRRFFLRGSGANSGMARVRDELRALVTFRKLNLLDDKWPIAGPFDAIFCRNVMIYFDKPTQYRILEKFAPLMAPHGLLFAGHSESFHHATDLFTLRGKTVYELARSTASAAMTGLRHRAASG